MSEADETGKIARPSRGGVRLETATLGITTVAGAAVALGAYFYVALISTQKDMIGEMRGVRDALSAMDRRVTVLEAPALDAHIRDLEKRVTVLEAQRGR